MANSLTKHGVSRIASDISSPSCWCFSIENVFNCYALLLCALWSHEEMLAGHLCRRIVSFCNRLQTCSPEHESVHTDSESRFLCCQQKSFVSELSAAASIRDLLRELVLPVCTRHSDGCLKRIHQVIKKFVPEHYKHV